jgi:hypothetical protein
VGKKKKPVLTPARWFFSRRPSSGLATTFSRSCGRRTRGEGDIVAASLAGGAPGLGEGHSCFNDVCQVEVLSSVF